MAANLPRTKLRFHYDAKVTTLETTILAVIPFIELPEVDRLLYKQGTPDDYAIVVQETIFHPQGGGQPSDIGTISSTSTASHNEPVTFEVSHARTSSSHNGVVLHFGRSTTTTTATSSSTPGSKVSPPFSPNQQVTLAINPLQRHLFSRLHTSGHILGAAVRHLCESSIPNFDELKASHFPDSAACEFSGLIPSDMKQPIQDKLNQYVERDMEVEIEWWTNAGFRERGLERLIPRDENGKEMDPPEDEGGKWRVVNIVGAECYPCGGTHVEKTRECGDVKVKKVSRSKGQSRVSYSVS